MNHRKSSLSTSPNWRVRGQGEVVTSRDLVTYSAPDGRTIVEKAKGWIGRLITSPDIYQTTVFTRSS